MAKQCLEPISYRFMRRGKDWYLMATTDCSVAEVITNRKLGAIGVDLNAGFIAIAEVDRFGNPLGEHAIPIAMYKRTSDQVAAALGDAVKEIVPLPRRLASRLSLRILTFRKRNSFSGKTAKVTPGCSVHFVTASSRLCYWRGRHGKAWKLSRSIRLPQALSDKSSLWDVTGCQAMGPPLLPSPDGA